MNKQKRLTIGMGIFTFIIVVAFGSIILTEKAAVLMIPRIDKRISNYLDKNYKDILNKVTLEDTVYKNTIFEKKINFGFSEFINYIKVSDYNTKLDKI